jgi:hypothetical protein
MRTSGSADLTDEDEEPTEAKQSRTRFQHTIMLAKRWLQSSEES